MNDDESVRRAAEELVNYHGAAAAAVARERVEALTRGGDRRSLDTALRVLTVVEELGGS